MQSSDNEQQQSQPPHGQRARSSSQLPTPSRPGTPSQMSHYDPRSHYPHPSGLNPSGGAHRPPFTNDQRPGTPGGGSSRVYQYPPVATPSTSQAHLHAHPGYPAQMNQYAPSPTRDPGVPQFIPTPSQAMEYRQHADTSRQSHRRTGSVSSPLNPGYNPSPPIATQIPPGVPPSQHYPTQYASTSAVPVNYPSTSTGDRFVCSQCGATFSRAHDRKRHYETQHLESPPVHRCQHCLKEFSRGDSLKRHLDKGCDARDAD